MRQYNIKRISNIFSHPQYSSVEKPVQSGLAVTPQRAYDMMLQGVPISTQMANAEYFQDGTENPGEVTLDRQRGVDINDMWEEMHSINKRFSSAYSSYKKNKKKGDQLNE